MGCNITYVSKTPVEGVRYCWCVKNAQTTSDSCNLPNANFGIWNLFRVLGGCLLNLKQCRWPNQIKGLALGGPIRRVAGDSQLPLANLIYVALF